MENFFMIVFWIIFAFYALRLILRYLLPWLLTRFIRKMAGNMQQPFGQPNPPGQSAGETKVRMNQQDKPKIDPEIGEYIEFEDIKEPKKE